MARAEQAQIPARARLLLYRAQTRHNTTITTRRRPLPRIVLRERRGGLRDIQRHLHRSRSLFPPQCLSRHPSRLSLNTNKVDSLYRGRRRYLLSLVSMILRMIRLMGSPLSVCEAFRGVKAVKPPVGHFLLGGGMIDGPLDS